MKLESRFEKMTPEEAERHRRHETLGQAVLEQLDDLPGDEKMYVLSMVTAWYAAIEGFPIEAILEAIRRNYKNLKEAEL